MTKEPIAHIIEHAAEHCSEHGTRLTNKRKQVLTGLLLANKALSAYELAAIYESEFGETLPPMSIYRILRFLVAYNLAHRLELANKYIACEHICRSHAHGIAQFLICRDCNKVSEINMNQSTIDDLQTSAQNAGFRLTSSQLELSCICKACIDATDD